MASGIEANCSLLVRVPDRQQLPTSGELIAELESADVAKKAGALKKAILTVLPDSARPLLAEASELTEALRRKDTYYHAELQWWTADSEKSDGMPYGVLVSAEDRDRVDVARAFPAGEHSGLRPEVARDHSMIVVLSTFGDSRREALGCGEALSAVLLEATLADLATCTLTHLTELPESRAIIRRLTAGRTDPQVLIRVGQVPESGEAPRTPRRPLAEVLEIRV